MQTTELLLFLFQIQFIWRWVEDTGVIKELEVNVELPNTLQRIVTVSEKTTQRKERKSAITRRKIFYFEWTRATPEPYIICVEAEVGQYICVKDGVLSASPLRQECDPAGMYTGHELC